MDWELDAWHRIVARVDDPQPFVTPEWQRAWWAHLGWGELAVVPLSVDGETVAVAAVHRDAGGTVRFLGGDDVTDYPGPAVAPGCGRTVAAGLLDWLVGSDTNWRTLDLRNGRPEDDFARELQEAAESAGLPTFAGEDEPVAILDLPATWDEYLGLLRRQPRRELLRKERRLFRELPAARLRTADARTLAADMDSFIRLCRLAPGAKGSFWSEPMERFFRRIADDFLAAGTLRLDVLEDGEQPLAMTFGFETERTFYLYNMAFDPAASSLSPGKVLLSLMLRRTISNGRERFDFLRGLERYKLELGATVRYLRRVRVQAR